MARTGKRLTPARIVAPGMVIRRELDARGWTQEDLARIMDRPVQVISEIVSAKKQITPETALGLAAALGTSAEMWLQIESSYRLRLAEEKTELTDVGRRSRIYSILPVKELVRRGWIEECREVDELEERVERFLGLDSLDELPPLKVAARRTATRDPDPRAVLAWIRRVEALAATQEVGTFEPRRLGEVVDQLVDLSRQDDGPVQVSSVLRDGGVGFVLVKHLPRTFFDGAVLWVGGNPVVALTLRHDRLDSFWFTLMHEVAHLVLGHEGGRLDDLDGGAGTEPEEIEADELASKWLVPGESLTGFVEQVRPYFSRHAIWSFAHHVGRHPAVVLGRLQHDGHVPQAHLRSSIPRVRYTLEPFIDVAEPIWDVRVDQSVASVRDQGPPYDPQGAVLEWLRSHPGWNNPAAIKNALRLDRSTWNRAIRTLLDVGQIERIGEKRGTKYRAIDPDHR